MNLDNAKAVFECLARAYNGRVVIFDSGSMGIEFPSIETESGRKFDAEYERLVNEFRFGLLNALLRLAQECVTEAMCKDPKALLMLTMQDYLDARKQSKQTKQDTNEDLWQKARKSVSVRRPYTGPGLID